MEYKRICKPNPHTISFAKEEDAEGLGLEVDLITHHLRFTSMAGKSLKEYWLLESFTENIVGERLIVQRLGIMELWVLIGLPYSS